MMERRPLGDTGLSVSEIAFGGVEIGMPYGIKHDGDAAMPTAKEAINLLRTARDSGINFFDTARLYGNSEELMGRAFNTTRSDVVLCTKCVHFKDVDGTVPHDEPLKRIVQRSLEQSLTALQTDYLDVFMLHLADMDILANEAVARIFTDLRSSGRVRAIGVSVYTNQETHAAIAAGIWNVIQLPFNLLNQQQSQYFDAAAEAGIGLVVRSVLVQGLLSERVKPTHPSLGNVTDHIDRYRHLAKANGMDLPTLAIRFALSFERISTVLVGIDRMDYLEAALDVGNAGGISEQLQQSLSRLAFEQPEFINLHQWKQNGWI